MDNFPGMQVGHSSCDVSGKGEAEPPVQGDVVILEDVVEASLGAVLVDKVELMNVLHSGSDELAQVWVIQRSIEIMCL